MIDSNYKKIRQVLVVTLVLNLIVSITKIILGTMVKSDAVYTDGFHSLSDGFNNIVGIIALSIAYKPADENHPYGHKKIETISSLFIGFILLLMGFNLIKENLINFNEASSLKISNLSIIIMLLTMFVNIFVTRYELVRGKALNSSFLISDAKHTLSDVYISASVIISLIGIKFFNLPAYFDSIMSFFVVIFIVKAGFSIIVEAIKVLSDARLVNPDKVEKIVLTFKEVYECHMIKSRGFENFAFLELHILVDPKMSVYQAHELNHNIEGKIKQKIMKNINVIIHIEPFDHIHND